MGRQCNSYVQPYSCYELACVLLSAPEVDFPFVCGGWGVGVGDNNPIKVSGRVPLSKYSFSFQTRERGKMLMHQAKVR